MTDKTQETMRKIRQLMDMPESSSCEGLAEELFATMNKHLVQRSTMQIGENKITPMNAPDIAAELATLVLYAIVACRTGTQVATGFDMTPDERLRFGRMFGQMMATAINMGINLPSVPDAG